MRSVRVTLNLGCVEILIKGHTRRSFAARGQELANKLKSRGSQKYGFVRTEICVHEKWARTHVI